MYVVCHCMYLVCICMYVEGVLICMYVMFIFSKKIIKKTCTLTKKYEFQIRCTNHSECVPVQQATRIEYNDVRWYDNSTI